MAAPQLRDPSDLGQLSEVGEFLQSYQRRPNRFAEEILRQKLCAWQRAALAEFIGDDDYGQPGCQKFSIRGCTTSGKNRLSAVIAWHTLMTKFYSKTTATAPNAATLDDNVFGECSAVYRAAPLAKRLFEMRGRSIVAGGDAGREWWMRGRVAKTSKGGGRQSEGMAGRYAFHTLALCDEASHPDMDPRIDALEGSATSPQRLMLVQGNALRAVGRFYDIHTKPRTFGRDYKLRRVGYLDSPWTGGIDPDEVGQLSDEELARRAALRAVRENWRLKFGENSVYYRGRALGEFPLETSSKTTFAPDVVAAAQARFGQFLVERDDPSLPIFVGIDCARYGDDETVWYFRRGLVTLWLDYAGKTDGPTISGRAIQTAIALLEGRFEIAWTNNDGFRQTHTPRPHPDFGKPGWDPRRHVQFRIDVGGLAGLGPPDYMRPEGWIVADVNNGQRPTQGFEQRYKNLATELWMEDALNFARVGSLFPDEVLAQQLETREYRFTGLADQLMLESKDSMKHDRGLGSPDRGDAFVLAAADGAKIDVGGGDLSRKIVFL